MQSSTIAKVGRNERCPCGSGKKYKQCCLRAEPAAAYTEWKRQKTVSDRLSEELMNFAGREFWDGFRVAWEEFNLSPDPPRIDELPAEGQIFWPWFLYDWDPDRPASLSGDSPSIGLIVRSFSQSAGSRLSELELLMLEQAITQPVSFYDVVLAEPGERIVLRDILLGGETEVIERTASRTMRAGDVCYGQIWRVLGVNTLGRLAPAVIPPSRKVEVIELRATLRRKIANEARDLAAQDLLRHAEDLRALYLKIRNAMRLPPILVNTDGDRILFHTLTFRIGSAQAAFDALASLAWGHTKEELWEGAELHADGTLARIEFPWTKAGNEKFKTWDNTILGQVTIDGQELVVTVNSAERAQMLRAEVDRRLGSLAEHRKTVRETPEQAMKDPKRKGAPSATGSAESPLDPELLREAQAVMQRQIESWVTEPVPSLGGRTPLEAVGDPDGKEMVEAMLLELERNVERSRGPGTLRPDVGAVRRMLQLA